jgi:acyl-coenzyme A synthetase/AMP-(fatty) acid ligase
MNWSERFRQRGKLPAVLTGAIDSPISYLDLANEIDRWNREFLKVSICEGKVVAFPAQYNLASIGLLFALADCQAIAVPLPSRKGNDIGLLLELADADFHLDEGKDEFSWVQKPVGRQRPSLYVKLDESCSPGIVLFTSGTTGQPKVAVHNFAQLCTRYAVARSTSRMLGFMQMDHIGGVNTLLFILSHGGSLVSPRSRTPQDVCEVIQQHGVEVLPVSPTFINLMLIAGVFEKYDLSSLKRITYGSEPMPESVLHRLASALPNVELLQTYGTTEVGILKSKSRDNHSLWMKVGGDGFETKIVDGRLYIKAETAMLGYLNAPSPFDEEGFMDTGDQVELHGEWLRILGRKSETINVGGQKVSPVEVESVLLEMPNVLEVAVKAEYHPMVGQVVSAQVRLSDTESLREFKQRMRLFCLDRLPQYAIPVKVALADSSLITDRFKRAR